MTPQEELDAHDAQRASLVAKVHDARSGGKFPCMVYQDLENDGDVSHPSNQKTVKDAKELAIAIKDGWVEDPNDIKKKPGSDEPKTVEFQERTAKADIPPSVRFNYGTQEPAKGLKFHDEVAKSAEKAIHASTAAKDAAKAAADREDDKADEAAFEKASDKAASKRGKR